MYSKQLSSSDVYCKAMQLVALVEVAEPFKPLFGYERKSQLLIVLFSFSRGRQKESHRHS